MKGAKRLMLAHTLPVLIMFFCTVVIAALFFIPITKFPRKNKLLNFYWVGFWIFLVIIAAVAGSSSTLNIIGYDASQSSKLMLAGISASFVFFVMFAWFRLSAKAIAVLITRGRNKFKAQV